MATKFLAVTKNMALVGTGLGGTAIADPLLREVVAGVEQAVAPHIVIPMPKATPAVSYVPTNLAGAVGAINVRHSAAGAINHDIVSIRVHSAFR
jgi:hypothetical protein